MIVVPPMQPTEEESDAAEMAVDAAEVMRSRESIYGDAKNCHTSIGKCWGAMLDIPDIPPEKVAMMMCQLKLIRCKYKFSVDNFIDLYNYAGMAHKWQRQTDDTIPVR